MKADNHSSIPAVNRIESCFTALRRYGRKALIPFLVAGDPDLTATRDLALTLLTNGADLLEIGVPFSDPCAEGPVIMAADARALAGGTRLRHVFSLVRDLRQQTEAPLILLLYYNTAYRFGLDRFFRYCRLAGVDGVIIPDLPLEEQDEAAPLAEAANVTLIRMVTPLSGDRMTALADGARGFMYCVAALGVTGERGGYSTDLPAYARELAAVTDLPRALGFGISTPEQIRHLAPDWDALIVGSAIVRKIAEGVEAGLSGTGLCAVLATFCQSLRQALDSDRPAPEAVCTPSAADFQRLACSYHLIPVIRRVNADTVTPIALFRRFDDQKSAWLLESVLGGERWARYSIMGRRPLFRLAFPAGDPASDPAAMIRSTLAACAMPPELTGDGFRCGLVGYFSYDFVRSLERLPDNNPDELGLPDCDLAAPSEVVLYDHLKSELTLIVNVLTGSDPVMDYQNAVTVLEKLASDIFAKTEDTPQSESSKDVGLMQLDFKSNISQDDFISQVRRAKQYIRRGDIFQVVLSQRFSAPCQADPFSIYRALRHVNPSPYLFYLRLPEAVLVGASPEMLVRITGQAVETCPIAGTRNRGKTAAEDQALAAELLTDTKELAEHAMLVDLARNDIGRISRYGTVQVKDFCHVERFSHVMHLVSSVEGKLRQDCSAIDVLGALLPAGTLSGAPKIRAMEIIDELETCRRGPYGGAVGYLGFDGQLDTCITIRTAVLKAGQIQVQAGAGIVADSIPETEYRETVNKAMALFAAIGKAGDFT